MVKDSIIPIPDATVGEVLGLIEVLYSYGGKERISFLAEELKIPMDDLGEVIDMAELFKLMKVKNGIATLTIYGEALCLGTINDKKRILKRKIPTIEPFKTTILLLKKGYIEKNELFEQLRKKFPIMDAERFHKLFVGWGTYAEIFKYNSQEQVFKTISKE